MTIQICILEDGNPNIITTLNGIASDPFSLNDIIHLDVDELKLSDYKDYPAKLIGQLVEKNAEFREKFRLKDVILVEVKKFLDLNSMSEDKLTIEYMCEFV